MVLSHINKSTKCKYFGEDSFDLLHEGNFSDTPEKKLQFFAFILHFSTLPVLLKMSWGNSF